MIPTSNHVHLSGSHQEQCRLPLNVVAYKSSDFDSQLQELQQQQQQHRQLSNPSVHQLPSPTKNDRDDK